MKVRFLSKDEESEGGLIQRYCLVSLDKSATEICIETDESPASGALALSIFKTSNIAVNTTGVLEGAEA